jgi:hypothetical protein
MSRDFVVLLELDSSAGIVSVREWDLRRFCTETGLPVLGLVADRPVEGTGNESSATGCIGCLERCPERPRECSRFGVDIELEPFSLSYLNADLV